MPKSQRLHSRCACAGAVGPFALAATERKYERSRPFAVRHLDLALVLDFDRRALDATAILDFERISPSADELELDAVGFQLSRVELDGGRGWSRAVHEYDGDRLTISVPRKVETGRVRIRYGAKPRRGLYFLAPDDQVPHRPVQVWSQCQDEDARHWFPCHDKPHNKMTTSLEVKVPSGFVALSNGDLVSERAVRGKKGLWSYRFEMKEPVPSYLVTLVAGSFEIVEDVAAMRPDGTEIPVAYYVPPGRAEDAERAFGETPRMVELFGRLTGVPYPFSRYSQIVVSDFIFGGMENTTATTMYEHILLDEKAALDISSEDLVAHELAHHWFGDYVTCRDWSHAWLNEGFATFFEHVEREDRLGRDEYEYGIAGDQSAYLSEANGRYQRAIVCRDYEEPIDLFDRHLYEKGALVLHTLRRELGDELFWQGVSRYLHQNARGIVETRDLLRALEHVSGRSFEQLFDQWVYRPGHPVLKVKTSYEKGLLTVSVKQTQKGDDVAVFALPIEIEIGDKQGKVTRHLKRTTEREDALVVRCSERPSWVAFDPDFRVIGSVTFEAPADMLRSQLARASTARLRWLAAGALRKRADPDTIEALGKTLSKQPEAWMVRAEAARALGTIRGETALSSLEKNAKTAHPKVRRAIAAALGQFRLPDAAQTLSRLAKRDPSYLVEAEAAQALGRTRQPGVLDQLVKLLDGPSWADVKRAGALAGLAALRDEAAVAPVLERTRYGVPTRARRAAISAASRLSDDRKVRETLEDLLDDADPYVRLSTVAALARLGDSRARPALRARLERELDGRVARRLREALRDLGRRDAAERRRMNDEIESLKGDLAELKTRISKLEGRKKTGRRGKGGGKKKRAKR